MLRGPETNLSVAGQFGNGLKVTSEDDIQGVYLPNGSAGPLNAVTKALTVELWYKPDSPVGTWYLADKRQAGSLGYGFRFYGSADGNLTFDVGKDNGLASERTESVSTAGLSWSDNPDT